MEYHKHVSVLLNKQWEVCYKKKNKNRAVVYVNEKYPNEGKSLRVRCKQPVSNKHIKHQKGLLNSSERLKPKMQQGKAPSQTLYQLNY